MFPIPRSIDLVFLALLAAAGCGTVEPSDQAPPGGDPDGAVDGGPRDGAPVDAMPPNGIRFGDEVVDPGEAGLEGPDPFRNDCPPEQAVVSMTGALGSIPGTTVVGKLRAHCGIPTVVVVNGAPRVTTRIGMQLPEHGMGEDVQAWSRPCAEGELVIGFGGRAGTRLDQLIVRCAALLLEPSDGGWRIARGPITSLVPVGADTGAPFAAIDCPPGQVATAVTGRVETQVAGFGVLCREAIAR